MEITEGSLQYEKFDAKKYYIFNYNRQNVYFNNCMKHYYEVYNSDKFKGTTLLDLCSGPTLHWLAAPSRKYTDITVSDLVHNNLIEVNKWLQKDPDAIDWAVPFKWAAVAEDISDHTIIEERVRKAVKHVIPCDILQENPLLNITKQYDAVQCTLGVDSATRDPDCLNTIIKNISNVVKPGGALVMFNTVEATHYTFGSQRYPKMSITRKSLVDALSGAGFEDIAIQEINREEVCREYLMSQTDFKGFILSIAFKKH